MKNHVSLTVQRPLFFPPASRGKRVALTAVFVAAALLLPRSDSYHTGRAASLAPPPYPPIPTLHDVVAAIHRDFGTASQISAVVNWVSCGGIVTAHTTNGYEDQPQCDGSRLIPWKAPRSPLLPDTPPATALFGTRRSIFGSDRAPQFVTQLPSRPKPFSFAGSRLLGKTYPSGNPDQATRRCADRGRGGPASRSAPAIPLTRRGRPGKPT